jgi:hypothetical protein
MIGEYTGAQMTLSPTPLAAQAWQHET